MGTPNWKLALEQLNALREDNSGGISVEQVYAIFATYKVPKKLYGITLSHARLVPLVVEGGKRYFNKEDVDSIATVKGSQKRHKNPTPETLGVPETPEVALEDGAVVHEFTDVEVDISGKNFEFSARNVRKVVVYLSLLLVLGTAAYFYLV